MTTLNDLRLDGYTHLNCACHSCARMVSLRIATLPVDARPLTLSQLAKRLRCKKCDQPTDDVSPSREQPSPKMW